MNDLSTYPAPEIVVGEPAEDVWSRERRAFRALLPTLLTTHAAEFVAIHQGQVVARGRDRVDVAQRAYAIVGYVPVYLGHVSETGPRPARVASPRFPQDAGPR